MAELAVFHLIYENAGGENRVVYTGDSVIVKIGLAGVSQQESQEKLSPSRVQPIHPLLKHEKGGCCNNCSWLPHKLQICHIWHAWVPSIDTAYFHSIGRTYCPGHAGMRGKKRADPVDYGSANNHDK